MGVLSGSITPAQRYQYARDAGFSGPDAVVMAAISLLECGNCDMSAVNASGDSSLWQINRMHGYSVAWLADPANSAKAAYNVWKSQGFGGWCTYPGGCGGASTITWATFNAKLAQVTASLAGAGIATPTGPVTSTDPSGDGSTTNDGNSTTSTTTGSPSTGINLGAVGPFPVNIPTGFALGAIGVVLLLIGALIFSASMKSQIVNTVVDAAT